MVPVEDWLLWMLGRKGDPYVYGAENVPGEVGPGTPSDCSELLQWAGDSAGVTPAIPDGSYAQWDHIKAHGTVLTVAMALTIRGAALFTEFDARGPGHVAANLGDGTTIEARGRLYGIGCFPATTARFTAAGLFPGIDYTDTTSGDDGMARQWAAPVPWQPAVGGREPFLVVNEVEGTPTEFTVVSLDGARFHPTDPAWKDGQVDPAHASPWWRDEQFAGLWIRHYLGTGGRIFGTGLCYEDHVTVACEGGATYEIARR